MNFIHISSDSLKGKPIIMEHRWWQTLSSHWSSTEVILDTISSVVKGNEAGKQKSVRPSFFFSSSVPVFLFSSSCISYNSMFNLTLCVLTLLEQYCSQKDFTLKIKGKLGMFSQFGRELVVSM